MNLEIKVRNLPPPRSIAPATVRLDRCCRRLEGDCPCPLITCPHAAEYIRFLPEIILCVFGTLLMVLEAITDDVRKRCLGRTFDRRNCPRIAGELVRVHGSGPAFQNMLMVDGFATFFRVLVMVVGILCVLGSASAI